MFILFLGAQDWSVASLILTIVFTAEQLLQMTKIGMGGMFIWHTSSSALYTIKNLALGV